MTEFIVRYWLEVLFGLLLAMFGFIFKKFQTLFRDIVKGYKEESDNQKLLKLAVQAMLRDRLIQHYNYHMDIGYCEIHDMQNITNMYDQYHKLGANGVMDSLIEKLLDLPVKEIVKV